MPDSLPPKTPPKQPAHPEWDQDCTLKLREFLETREGRLTLEWLKFWSPSLLDGSDVNRTLVASGEVKGYTATLENIFSLARENPIPEPPKILESYPDPEDDSKWDESENKRPD